MDDPMDHQPIDDCSGDQNKPSEDQPSSNAPQNEEQQKLQQQSQPPLQPPQPQQSSSQLPSPLPPLSTSVSSFIQQQQQQHQQQLDSQSSQESGGSKPFDPMSANSNNIETSHGPPSVTINNILEAIEEFDSSIPDAVVHHFLNVSGMQTSDQRIIRLIAIAAQKFIYDIVSDSLQHCKLHGAQGKKTKDKKYTLAIEDLSAALAEYGIEVRRQQYFN